MSFRFSISVLHGSFPKFVIRGTFKGVVIPGMNRGFMWFCKVYGLGVPKIQGTLFGGPYKKDSSILGSILGKPLHV